MKVVVISDVHGKWKQLTVPDCDLLISTGDYSFKGEHSMINDFHKWLNMQPAKHIISGQGNHEKAVELNFDFCKQIALKKCPRAHFIDEGLIEIEGKRIWYSAITRFFHNWAWNRHPGADIQRHWDLIPNNLDIIATHGPCYGILDYVTHNGVVRNLGDPQLLQKVLEVKPKVFVSGHIHYCGGISKEVEGITFINASNCGEDYRIQCQPMIFNI